MPTALANRVDLMNQRTSRVSPRQDGVLGPGIPDASAVADPKTGYQALLTGLDRSRWDRGSDPLLGWIGNTLEPGYRPQSWLPKPTTLSGGRACGF